MQLYISYWRYLGYWRTKKKIRNTATKTSQNLKVHSCHIQKKPTQWITNFHWTKWWCWNLFLFWLASLAGYSSVTETKMCMPAQPQTNNVWVSWDTCTTESLYKNSTPFPGPMGISWILNDSVRTTHIFCLKALRHTAFMINLCAHLPDRPHLPTASLLPFKLQPSPPPFQSQTHLIWGVITASDLWKSVERSDCRAPLNPEDELERNWTPETPR